MGLGFEKIGKTISWEMGFGQNSDWEMGFHTPPPPFRTVSLPIVSASIFS